jgi:spermidine synthase
MYHVVGIGLTAILFYLISYFFYHTGLYTLQFHRKIWNTILATTFFFTALAGLVMALQLTYRWDVPNIKSILKWHVEVGLGMTITGIFHFIWHLSYFRKIFEPQNNSEENIVPDGMTSASIKTNLFIIGFVSSSIQLLMIREMMNISGGYELIAGFFLASWLLGSAIGAAIAGKSNLMNIRKINLVFSISPIISLLLLLFLSRLFFDSGETPSLLVSLIYTFLVLIPFCLISGFTFVKLISIAKSYNGFVPGKSFSVETTGGIIAGITISFMLSGQINTYKLLFLIIILTNAYAALNNRTTSPKTSILIKCISLLLASAIIITNPDNLFRQILLPGIKVADSEDTAYGNITTGSYMGDKSVYYNQRLLLYNDDAMEREENIHYVMLQSRSPEKVILISGSLNSLLPELEKYSVKKVIYIERDPALIKPEIAGNVTFSGDLIISNKDAFRYIRNSNELVDAVILLVPPPSTLLLNRYYTTEFFSDVKRVLKPGGVFLCSPGPGDTYFNGESLNLYSSIYNSLSGVFKRVEPVVGNKLYFISSDSVLSLSFCMLSENKGIRNTYVSPDYLSDDLIKKRSDEVVSLMDKEVKPNRSEFPVACFHFLSYNFSKNLNEKTPSLILIIVMFAVPLFVIKKKNMLMFFSASSLAGFEIIILLTLQITIGNMYHLTGLVIAGLMTGLAVGSGCDIRLLRTSSILLKCLVIIVFYLCIGLIYSYLIKIKSEYVAIMIIMLSAFFPGIITGNLFRELTIKSDNILCSSAVYSADLSGSAFGFIFISGFAVPALGIKLSIYLLSLFVLTGFLFGTLKNK